MPDPLQREVRPCGRAQRNVMFRTIRGPIFEHPKDPRTQDFLSKVL